MNRQQAEKRGRGAETLACWYLRLKGWQILARRARVPGGEVDIVARRGRMLAFVEVKARASEAEAAIALDEWRLRCVVTAAERLARTVDYGLTRRQKDGRSRQQHNHRTSPQAMMNKLRMTLFRWN